MAWLHATPKPPPDPRTRKGQETIAEPAPAISRIDGMKRDGIAVQMPPNPAPHLVAFLVEMGISEVAGMGMAPLSWREINAWCEGTRVDLAPWERRLIRKMSTEYLAEGRRAEDEYAPAPWRTKRTQREIDVEQARLELLFG